MKSHLHYYRRAAFAAFALCAFSANAAIVTTPAGTVTGPISDPFVADTWLRADVRVGSTAGITTNFTRSGDGSAYMTSSDGSGKADWVYYKTGGFGKLSAFSSYSYDWYRASSSTVAAHLHPVIRLIIDIDGNLSTNDPGYLIFERAYNPDTSAVQVNTWVTETITGTTNLWFRQPSPGPGTDEGPGAFQRTLADYQAGTYTPTSGFAQVTGESVVVGISMGIGSGWTGTFEGAVDNPTLGAFTSNFEVKAPVVVAPAATPVPTLDLAGLLALSGAVGVAGAALARRRRRTTQSSKR